MPGSAREGAEEGQLAPTPPHLAWPLPCRGRTTAGCWNGRSEALALGMVPPTDSCIKGCTAVARARSARTARTRAPT